MQSSLTNGTYIAYVGNYQKGRGGHKVCKITPHQMRWKINRKTMCSKYFWQKRKKSFGKLLYRL